MKKSGTKKQEYLINVLSEAQKKHGFLSESLLKNISKKTNTSIAKVYSTATFYAFLPVEKKGKYIIRVCNSPSCYVNGSENILEEIKKIIAKNKKFSLEKTSCIGCCNNPPAIMINDKPYTKLTKEKVKSIIKKLR